MGALNRGESQGVLAPDQVPPTIPVSEGLGNAGTRAAPPGVRIPALQAADPIEDLDSGWQVAPSFPMWDCGSSGRPQAQVPGTELGTFSPTQNKPRGRDGVAHSRDEETEAWRGDGAYLSHDGSVRAWVCLDSWLLEHSPSIHSPPCYTRRGYPRGNLLGALAPSLTRCRAWWVTPLTQAWRWESICWACACGPLSLGFGTED